MRVALRPRAPQRRVRVRRRGATAATSAGDEDPGERGHEATLESASRREPAASTTDAAARRRSPRSSATMSAPASRRLPRAVAELELAVDGGDADGERSARGSTGCAARARAGPRTPRPEKRRHPGLPRPPHNRRSPGSRPRQGRTRDPSGSGRPRARGCRRPRGMRRPGRAAPSHASNSTAPTMPITHAAPIETEASATRTELGMDVSSGRLRSSSSACAPTPTARPKATTAAPSRPQATSGARQPPMTTKERCQAVYGRWRSVT